MIAYTYIESLVETNYIEQTTTYHYVKFNVLCILVINSQSVKRGDTRIQGQQTQAPVIPNYVWLLIVWQLTCMLLLMITCLN